MKQTISVLAAWIFTLAGYSVPLQAASAPTLLSYQGRVAVEGQPFHGVGQFKFALVDGGANLSEPATAQAQVQDGRIVRIDVLNRGSGYLDAPTVTITDSTGSGASAQAVVQNGGILEIRVVQSGQNYSSNPQVGISPPRAEVRYESLWSHDGSSSEGSEPRTAVPVGVTDGLFTVLLGDTHLVNMIQPLGSDVFQRGMGRLRIWFSDGVRPFAQLSPDQPLGTLPYAFVAQTVTDNTISTGALINNAVTTDKIKDGTVTLADLNAQVSGAFWATSGNAGIAPDTDFLGTTDNQPLQMKVNGTPALRLEPQLITPNVIGGAGNAYPGVNGAAIGGGGTRFVPNIVAQSFGTVAGGVGNETYGAMASIGGGAYNRVLSNAENAHIGGGLENLINPQSTNALIGAGTRNVIGSNAYWTVIAGGKSNEITRLSEGSVIGGGTLNRLQGAYNVLMGGRQNTFSNGTYSVLGGGRYNTNAMADYAVISGGYGNAILQNADRTVIGGGEFNTVAWGATAAVIPGGSHARARNYGQWAFASGALDNAGEGGDAQTSLYVLRGITQTNVAETELFLDGRSGRITLPVGGSMAFEILAVYRSTADFVVPPIPPYFPGGLIPAGSAGAVTARGVITHLVERNRTEFSGTPVVTTFLSEDAEDHLMLGIDSAQRALVVKVRASLPARWVARVKTVEVVGP